MMAGEGFHELGPSTTRPRKMRVSRVMSARAAPLTERRPGRTLRRSGGGPHMHGRQFNQKQLDDLRAATRTLVGIWDDHIAACSLCRTWNDQKWNKEHDRSFSPCLVGFEIIDRVARALTSADYGEETRADVVNITRQSAGSRQRSIGDTCPRCGHIHHEDSECGEPLGGSRICRCEFSMYG